MRVCTICGRPTVLSKPTLNTFPEVTPETASKSAHIPDDELTRDLTATREEIAELEIEVESRKNFVTFLEGIQAARSKS